MSALNTDCWYGVYRIGDDQLVPDRLALLGQALQTAHGDRLSGKSIEVHRFEVFNNYQAMLRGTWSPESATNPSAFGISGSNALGWVVSGAVVSLIQSFNCEASLAPEKNPKNLPAIIVDVDLAVNGKRIVGNVVQLDPQGREEGIRGEITRERVKRALIATMNQAREEIGKALSAP